MSEPAGPPEQIVFTIDEALDLLSHLEDARSSFEEAGMLDGSLLIEEPIRLVNRKLGFDDPGDVFVMHKGMAHVPADALNEYHVALDEPR